MKQSDKNNDEKYQERLKKGKWLADCRQKKGLSLTQAGAEIGISGAYLNHIERGIRELNKKIIPAIAKAYDISASALSDDVTLQDRKDTCFREILTRSKIRLALVVSDVVIDRIFEDGEMTSSKTGGGAYNVAKWSQDNFVPIIVTKVGKNQYDKIVSDLNNEKSSGKTTRIVTALIYIDDINETFIHDIIIDKGKRRRNPYSVSQNHTNDFDLKRIKECIYMSGIGKGDVIFVHGYQLHRELYRIGGVLDSPQEEKNRLKKEAVNDFMLSLLPENDNERPFIVFDCSPPNKIYNDMTTDELAIIKERSDILIMEFRTIIGFLKEKKYKGKFEEIIKNGFEADGGIIRKYLDGIAQYFLGTKGNILIIRYGKKHLDRQWVLKRLEDGHYEATEEPVDTLGDEVPIDYGDMLTFKYLSKYLKEKEEKEESKD